MIVPPAFVYLVAGVLGAMIGSFVNVVVIRYQQERSFMHGRSTCPACGKGLRWFELVPIVSWLLQGGRCRRCRAVLSRQYVVVETLLAAAFVAVASVHGVSVITVVGWLMASAMMCIAVYDARWSLIPDPFSIVFGIAALTLAGLQWSGWQSPTIGVLLGGGFFAVQYALSRRRWVGSGDIIIGSIIGLVLGGRETAVAFLLAYLSAALVAVVGMANKKLSWSGTIAFGPYLMAAGFVTWLWGETIINWYLSYALVS